jgi:hypothetical protein
MRAAKGDDLDKIQCVLESNDRHRRRRIVPH